MTKLLQKLFCLTATGSILFAMPASAQSEWSDRDNNIYFYGVGIGSLSTACSLYRQNKISGAELLDFAKYAESKNTPKNYKKIVAVFSDTDDNPKLKKCSPYIR